TSGSPTAAAPTAAPTTAPSTAASAPVAEPAPPTPEPTPEPTEAPTTTPTSAASAPGDGADDGVAGLPAGWTTDSGAAGWTVALPPGYAQRRAGEYRQPETGRTLRVETGPGQPDAVVDRERAAASFARRHPSYEQIRIEPVDYRGYEAADWEFTYSSGGSALHVLSRVFVVKGRGYSLFFQTRAGDFADARRDFDGIARAFRPVGA
ncbi:MAG: hypothetical protein KY439_12415, partial [Actinobacteria bacterium]|nr:hypothetical protein [Actinomycetota bacterium]